VPELPEVHTTATGLQKVLPGLKIVDVWTDYNSSFYAGKDNIKDKKYFKKFRIQIIGKKVIGAGRRGKNVLIHLKDDFTILVHMKMTGHILYGTYRRVKSRKSIKSIKWDPVEPETLKDPFNRFIHFVITFSNGKCLALSDMRKFAKITLLKTSTIDESLDTKHLGPEPLEKNFTFEVFKKQLNKKPSGKIKTVLMDQSLVSGIGNIYSDEILWKTGIHPLKCVKNISNSNLKKIYETVKIILRKGIDFGGDSMSDYRNIHGEKGNFQHKHQAYRKTGEKCSKKNCEGIIVRIKVGGRSAHFCSTHQKI